MWPLIFYFNSAVATRTLPFYFILNDSRKCVRHDSIPFFFRAVSFSGFFFIYLFYSFSPNSNGFSCPSFGILEAIKTIDQFNHTQGKTKKEEILSLHKKSVITI